MSSKWDCETTTKFIREYRRHECLWNSNSPNYRDNEKRQLAYIEMMKSMCLPNLGIQEVRNKIKNIRSTYNQEMKKTEESKKQIPGFRRRPVYESNIKWLKELSQFYTCNDKRKSKVSTVKQPQEESVNQDSQEMNKTPTNLKQNVLKEPRAKRRKTIKIRPENHLIPLPNFDRELKNNTRDSSDVFGECVALQLKNMSDERALLAKCKIQAILTEYGIADLKDRKDASPSHNNLLVPSVTHTDVVFKKSPDYYDSAPSPVTDMISDDPLAQQQSPNYEYNGESPENNCTGYESDNKDALAAVVSNTFSEQVENDILGLEK